MSRSCDPRNLGAERTGEWRDLDAGVLLGLRGNDRHAPTVPPYARSITRTAPVVGSTSTMSPLPIAAEQTRGTDDRRDAELAREQRRVAEEPALLGRDRGEQREDRVEVRGGRDRDEHIADLDSIDHVVAVEHPCGTADGTIADAEAVHRPARSPAGRGEVGVADRVELGHVRREVHRWLGLVLAELHRRIEVARGEAGAASGSEIRCGRPAVLP